jgi:hypothetical protein
LVGGAVRDAGQQGLAVHVVQQQRRLVRHL